ncbi:DotU family type IV/VI secretion system protein [Paraburkholderia sp.]|uniref:DotU family type IV/VI secretion system protein n=1 Tax=Paraburkholderia sp. TaxID=1926495 RepID=UPI0025EC7182|nr:DotU family type IV/VI secretion system protein [Paraburkholderia sp.]
MTLQTHARNFVPLVDAAGGTSRFDGKGIRDLLRDTALLVTSLGPTATAPDAAQFRERCRQAIQDFSNALARRGYSEDVRREVLVAQCGLLDETALRHLSAESRASWELTPLQVEWFKVHDAGEHVIERIEARLRETPPDADLLECYSAILGMGFMGRYARDGEARRAALVAALNTRLEKIRPPVEQPFMTDRAARRISDWFYRLSPWAIAGVSCAAAAIVWGIWSVALDNQLAHIAPAKVDRP